MTSTKLADEVTTTGKAIGLNLTALAPGSGVHMPFSESESESDSESEIDDGQQEGSDSESEIDDGQQEGICPNGKCFCCHARDAHWGLPIERRQAEWLWYEHHKTAKLKVWCGDCKNRGQKVGRLQGCRPGDLNRIHNHTTWMRKNKNRFKALDILRDEPAMTARLNANQGAAMRQQASEKRSTTGKRASPTPQRPATAPSPVPAEWAALQVCAHVYPSFPCFVAPETQIDIFDRVSCSGSSRHSSCVRANERCFALAGGRFCMGRIENCVCCV
jgi:hypothetical protein